MLSNWTITYLAWVWNDHAIVSSTTSIIASEIVIRPSIKIFIERTMMPITRPSHFAFASLLKSDLNGNVSRMIYEALPETISSSVLASGVSITDCSIRTHSRYLHTISGSVSSKSPWTCALVWTFSVDTSRICSTSCNSLATLINIFATLALESMINSCWHVKPLGVVAMITWWTWCASKSGRQVSATDSRITWLNQVALNYKETTNQINYAFKIKEAEQEIITSSMSLHVVPLPVDPLGQPEHL